MDRAGTDGDVAGRSRNSILVLLAGATMLALATWEVTHLGPGGVGQELHIVAITVHGMGAAFAALVMIFGVSVGRVPGITWLRVASVTVSLSALAYLAGLTLTAPNWMLASFLLGGWLVGAGSFVLGSRRTGASRRSSAPARVVTTVVVLTVAVGFAVCLAGPLPSLDGRPEANPVPAMSLLRLQTGLLCVLGLGVGATVRAARLARMHREPWSTTFAISLFLAASSMLQRLVVLTPLNGDPRTGSAVAELLLIGSGVLLVAAAVQFLRAHVSAVSEAREASVRRTIATQLHDGLAQDLAVVASQSTRLARLVPTHQEELGLVVLASVQALETSRAAIEALRHEADPGRNPSVPSRPLGRS
jgi:signal transduction histidine kinase